MIMNRQSFTMPYRCRPAGRLASAGSRYLAIAADTEHDGTLSETAARIRDLAAQHQAFREKTGQRQHPMTPREELGWAALGDTLPC